MPSETTHGPIDQLEAGVDLDRLVAEAISRPACMKDGVCHIGINYRKGAGVTAMWKEFTPSTDWNAAIEAAEEMGLFDDWMLYKLTGEWLFQDHNKRDMTYSKGGACYVGAASGSLAICRAVLILKEQPDAK